MALWQKAGLRDGDSAKLVTLLPAMKLPGCHVFMQGRLDTSKLSYALCFTPLVSEHFRHYQLWLPSPLQIRPLKPREGMLHTAYPGVAMVKGDVRH